MNFANEPIFTAGGIQEVLRRVREMESVDLLEEMEEVRRQAAADVRAAQEEVERVRNEAALSLAAVEEQRRAEQAAHGEALAAVQTRHQTLIRRIAHGRGRAIVMGLTVLLVAAAVAAWLLPATSKWSAAPKVIVTVLAGFFLAASAVALISSAVAIGRLLERRQEKRLESK